MLEIRLSGLLISCTCSSFQHNLGYIMQVASRNTTLLWEPAGLLGDQFLNILFETSTFVLCFLMRWHILKV
jgi:hypothetical protein